MSNNCIHEKYNLDCELCHPTTPSPEEDFEIVDDKGKLIMTGDAQALVPRLQIGQVLRPRSTPSPDPTIEGPDEAIKFLEAQGYSVSNPVFPPPKNFPHGEAPQPKDWKNDKMKQFMAVLATRDNYFTRSIGGTKSILPMAQEAISDLLVEEKREAQEEILAPLNMVCVGDNWLSIQAYKDLLASLTHNI